MASIFNLVQQWICGTVCVEFVDTEISDPILVLAAQEMQWWQKYYAHD
jgi:hypothetical protein